MDQRNIEQYFENNDKDHNNTLGFILASKYLEYPTTETHLQVGISGIEELILEYKELQLMSISEVSQRQDQDIFRWESWNNKTQQGNAKTKGKIKHTLEKLQTWTPKTENNKEIKTTLIKTMGEIIESDDNFNCLIPKKINPILWRIKELQKISRALSRKINHLNTCLINIEDGVSKALEIIESFPED